MGDDLTMQRALFFTKLYLATVPVFFLIDMLWLGIVAKGFYRTRLAPLLRPDVNWTAAILFYLIYIAGIILFAVSPAVDKGSLARAAILGALFGFFTYATYDLTNLATLKGWPLSVAVVDIAWGTVLCTAVASAGYGIACWLR